MLGALIGAGASLIGSLFGSGSKKQETANYVDYGRMVRDAEAAGFNPLTALRNGGAAGFTVSSTPAAPLSSRLADGVAGATNSFLANFDPFQDKQREIGFKLAEAQLANLQADTSLKKVQFGGVPTYTGGTQKRIMGSGVSHGQTFKSAADALPASAGKSQTPTVETPTVTNPYPESWDITVDPNWPDAAAMEDRYGDDFGPGMFYGWGSWLNDQDRNWQRKIDEPVKKYFRDNYKKGTTPKAVSDVWNRSVRGVSPSLSKKHQYQ